MNEYKIIITQRTFSDINECVLFVSDVSKEAAKVLFKYIKNASSSNIVKLGRG